MLPSVIDYNEQLSHFYPIILAVGLLKLYKLYNLKQGTNNTAD